MQATIVQYFATAVKPGDALLFAVPNGEYRDIGTAVKLAGRALNEDAPDDAFLVPHGQGVLHGATDLILLSGGAVTDLIEVKAPPVAATPFSKKKAGGKMSRAQEIFRKAAIKLNHHHWVIDSVDQFDEILRARNVPLHAMLFPQAFGLSRREV